jgi:hypothetical protein
MNTDLEEIDQLLKSASGIPSQNVIIPSVLNYEMTKKFVTSLLSKYENEEDVEKKWEGFVKSVSSPPEF